MEHQNPTKTQCLNSDIISTLPQNIIEEILCLMPIRDALRTSILSKKWRYSWRSMPKLTFKFDMVTEPSKCSRLVMKYKLVNAIFHVLLFHNSPTLLVFNCAISYFHMEREFAQILSYLARGNKEKELHFYSNDRSYKLPNSFFSLQGLEHIHVSNCTFEPPLTSNGFSWLKSISFSDVEVSAQVLQQFLSKCPLVEHICLDESEKDIDSIAEGNTFTFVDLSRCVPLIQVLDISKYYMKYLSAGGMPHKLPAPLVHLKDLFFYVCLMDQNEISGALCMIRSAPILETIIFKMYDNEKLHVRQTPANFLDPEGYPDLKLDNLESLFMEAFSNLPLEMAFVKLIMAKSPVLNEVRIVLHTSISVDEEVKMLRDLVRHPIPRASPYAKLVIVRP